MKRIDSEKLGRLIADMIGLETKDLVGFTFEFRTRCVAKVTADYFVITVDEFSKMSEYGEIRKEFHLVPKD